MHGHSIRNGYGYMTLREKSSPKSIEPIELLHSVLLRLCAGGGSEDTMRSNLRASGTRDVAPWATTAGAALRSDVAGDRGADGDGEVVEVERLEELLQT